MSTSPRGPRIRSALWVAVQVAAGVWLVVSGGVFGVVCGILLLLGVALTASDWSYRIRTGERRPARVRAAFAQEGSAAVRLVEVGPRQIAVIKALREVSGADLLTAKRLTETAEPVVVTGVSQCAAGAIVDHLAAAGAAGRVESVPAG